MKSMHKTDIIRLKKLMIDRGIETKTQLAEISGINRNAITKILNGEKQPTEPIMSKLIICLNMSPDMAGEIFFVPNLLDE